MLDAAIIGGGPVGLATAAALLQAREPPLQVKVFERVEELKPCGAGLFLMPNGFRALHTIHPKLYANVKDITVAMDAHNRYTPDGNITKTFTTDMGDAHRKKYGFPSLMGAGWSDLRAVLAEWLPSHTLQLGKKFASLQQHEDHVEVHFTDSSSIKARVLVGADGNFSKVRQQTLDDGLPEFGGNTAIRARLPQQAGFPSTEIHQVNKGSFMGMYYPINNGNCVWSMAVPEHIMDEAAAKLQIQNVQRQEAEEKGHTNTGDTTGYALLRAKEIWGNDSSLVTTAMQATDPATVLEHKLYVRQPSSLDKGHWGVGQVTLAGDSAHPMRPTNGQGVNQGLEDAAELGRQVRAEGLTQASLRAYESTRIERIQPIMAAELASGLRAFRETNKLEHLPEDIAKYKFASEVWEKGTRPDLEYFDWLLRDTRS